ncbi:MAG: TIGR02757 family protein [Chitinophagales bacterium]
MKNAKVGIAIFDATMEKEKVFGLLERKYAEFNCEQFIANDPVSIPHRFKRLQDVEISGFFAATLAWGNRKSILASCHRLLELMDDAPFDFITNHKETDLRPFLHFKHRTFNATDVLYFIAFFKEFYKQHHSLEEAFFVKGAVTTEESLRNFHPLFFSLNDAPQRTRKHVANANKGSSCKRLNMFLRWMVRQDDNGVDLGCWKQLNASQLLMPLDVHVDRVARVLGLIKRKQTDFQTVLELTENLRDFDRTDPVKYDFALFGIGAAARGGGFDFK